MSQQQMLQGTIKNPNNRSGNPNDPDENPDLSQDQVEIRLSEALKQAQSDAEKYSKNDQFIKRKDTVEVIMDILTRIKSAAEEINKMSQERREKLYYLTFNATVLIYRLSHQLREASFAKEATHFLAFNILCLDNNLILTTAKYLDWRVMNYVELARAYADIGAFKAAIRVISYSIQKVLYLKQIEEQDPPVPDGTKEILVEALRILRTQELKYQFQAGVLSPEAWKKKIEETFSQNKYHRSLAIVECLMTNDPLNNRLVQRNAKNLTQKTQALKLCMELVKGDIELVKQALIQIHEKKKRDLEKKEQLMNRDGADTNIDELLEKYKALDAEMIKEKDWKFASYNVPIEVHVELLKIAFECKIWPEFEILLDPALVRLKFRRYETPYLATVDVLMSASKLANIPNGFEKIPKDMNAANLRIELKRLRAQAKLASGSTGQKQEEEKKKEEKKVQAPPAKGAPANDPKKKPDPKAAQQPVEIPKDEEDEQQIQATEAELDKIKHIYVNLLLQRTKNSQNAIVGIDVVLADENRGPVLPENHYAVAVPIRQHQGVYEKTKLIPYIVFKRTANSLIDEEDCLSIVTDVTVIMGQDAHLRAPIGYHKIPVDLRQTPKDLERVPNLDYVYICYKTDKQLALTERDLLVFRRIADLEKSYVEKTAPEFKQQDELRQFLNLSYNLETLVDLSRTIKESLLGPLGDYYLENRQDILFDITVTLWQKYLLPVMQRIDFYVEMRHQREFNTEFVEKMDEEVIQVKHSFVEAFNVIHRILTRFNFVEDMVMYAKFAVYLSNLQEELGEFRNAVQTLRSAIGKVVEYREERLKQCLDAKENVKTTMSITIDNKKIGELEAKIQTVYDTWEQLILRKERDRERREKELPQLDEDEGDEEQLEVAQCIDELKNKDLFERQINIEEWRKYQRAKNQLQGIKYFNEQEQIVHSLHCDLLVNLYRCEIKLGREMNVVKSQTNKLLISQGIDLSKHAPGNMTKNLSTSLNSKMNQTKNNKTLAKSKADLTQLKQTLQEAGKLPPPKPQIQSYEKILEKENNHNPYQNALLHMCLAVAKVNIVEQKSLLLESLEFVKKAKAQEEQLANLAIENSIYLRASMHYHDYFGKSADQIHPFNLMAQQQYIRKTTVPQKPVMVCRTSTSIIMKLPFYKPITEYKSWRNIQQMALFGKPSGSGVGVSLNNTEYEGTGEKRMPGSLVKVTGLIPNEKYVFAAGGYTGDGICVNGIGETSSEVITLLPLSMHQLYGYLAEIAYKLGHYQIAKQASEMLCSQFIEKNENFKYQFLDTRINPILAFKLNNDYLKLISPIEARTLAEAFIILARVSKVVKSDVQKRAEQAELKVEKQKIDMKICNYLLLAQDIAIMLNQPVLIKRCASEIFNHLLPYLNMNLRPQLLFQVLFKCHQSLRLVPSELVDANLRQIMGCLSYQLLKLGFEYAEDESFKRAMISELPLNTRRWRKYIQYLVRRPVLTEELRVKKEEQEKRIQLGEKIPENELIQDPEPYEEKVIKLDEFEVESAAFEEHLLSIIDYQDIVKAKVERWKLQINKYQKLISYGNESVEKLKDGLIQIVEFWEGVKVNNPQGQLQQILAAFDAGQANQKYLEFVCKCIRRAMELGLQSFSELEEILNSKIKLPEEMISQIENKLAERQEYLDKDIVRKQRRRFNLLEEKVQQMMEQKSVSGGNKITSLEKIQQLLEQQAQMLGEEEDYWGVVRFEGEGEEEKQSVYQFLWISEKFLLQGICSFLSLSLAQPQRSSLNLQINCVFNDVIQLDFNKYKQILDDHNDRIRIMREQFEEEHKKDNEKFDLKIDDRVKKMVNFLKIMAKAAEYAKNARAWMQLENIIRYTWNAFSYHLTTPLELKETEGWKYVVLLAEASLYLIEYLKGGGQLRKISTTDIDMVKNQKPTMLKEPGKTVAFMIQAEEDYHNTGFNPDKSVDTIASSQKSGAGGNGKGLKWFEKIQEFDVSIHASFIAFGVQCLMGVKKWESLVDISNRLNDATENTYAQYLLPFIIFAQTTLYQDAAHRTTSKRNDLQIRIQQFENWKATNKKKRSRQALITGEIPLEEQEFLREKAQMEKDIFRLEIIENVLKTDKQKSETLLENIKRDANNCEESLKQCRKLYFQFGVETQNLKTEEWKKGSTHFEIRTKRKGHKVFTSMVISNYKKCIELLRKRQEKFLLIQALHELGNLLYADGQLGEAEIQWNDCVDTIFQKLYVVNSWRQVFKDNLQLADSFGSKQCLIGAIVLTKLSKLCYEGRDQYRYNECLRMAADLFATPAKLSFPHPQVPIEYSSYRFREFLGDQLFVDKFILTPSEMLHTLGVAAQALIDFEIFEKALPIASLMEYVAFDICKSKQLVVKARILKAIALTEIGYINEAYQLYNRVLSMKDLPKIGSRESEYSQKKDGKNFHFPSSSKYHNHLPPENEKNLEAIQNLLKPITAEVVNGYKKSTSPYIIELLQYLRCIMLVRLGESENIEMPEKADFRQQLLKASEEALRNGILKNLAVQEEIAFIKEKLEGLVIKEIDIPEQEISDLRARLVKVYETYSISDEDQKVFYSNKEEEMCYADRRSQVLSLMMRSRMLIARISTKQGLLLQSFYVLKQALVNFKAYAEGKHSKIETGLEVEDKGSFKLPEIYGGSGLGIAAADSKAAAKGAPAAVGKQPPADPKKAAAKGAQAQQQDEEELKRLEEERKKREIEEEQREKAKVEQAEKRDHPQIYLWLRIKSDIIQILFHQKRWDDTVDALTVTRHECQSVGDVWVTRLLMEVEFMIEIYRGEIDQSAISKTADKIRKHAKAYNQNDMSFAFFLGNLSEAMYNRDHRAEANEAIKEGRMIVWYKLRDYGLDLDLQNINYKGDVKVNKSRPKLTEDVLAQYQSSIPAAGAKGAPGKPGAAAGKPGAPPGKPGQPQVQEDLPTEEEKVEPVIDFNQKIEYPLVPSDQALNSSYVEPNIYLKYLEHTVRFDVRYAQYLTLIEGKHDLAKKVLTDTEKLTKRTLHINPLLKFQVAYLLGHANLQIFYEKVREYQDNYTQKTSKYKDFISNHIPYGSIALCDYLIELPNFSDKLKKYFKDYLEWAKRSLKQAVDIAKNEAIVYEFDCSVVDALRELSEVNFLIMEYRTRVLSYKYAKFKELDYARKVSRKMELKKEAEGNTSGQVDDNILEDEAEKEVQAARDEWEEQKLNKEKLEISNAKKQAVSYFEQAIQASKSLREFQDKQHQLGQVSLTDPSKIPREIASEMFEAFQVTKVNYVKIPDFDPKDKTALTSSEVLAYLKALSKELEFFTFGEEKQRQSKLIGKIHRYLRLNLASYVQKCIPEIKECEEIKDANIADTVEYLSKGKIIGKWTDFMSQKSTFYYCIGPIDDQLLTQILPLQSQEGMTQADQKIRDALKKDHQSLHFGKLDVEPLVLSALYQESRDLIEKMKASEKLSPAQNERDKRAYRVKFDQLIEKFGILFKSPIVSDDYAAQGKGKGKMNEDVNVFDQIMDILPELTVDNVDKFSQLLQKDSGCLITDARLNTILRRFHRIRYVK